MTDATRHSTKRFSVVVAVAASLLGAVLVLAGAGFGDAWMLLVLIAVNAIGERNGVWITKTMQLSISLLPTLYAAVLWGPLPAAIVNACSLLGDPDLLARRDADRAPRLKIVSYASGRFITGASAGMVAQVILSRTGDGFGSLLAATLVAALVAEVLDIASVAAIVWARGRNPGPTLALLGPMLLTQVPIYSPLVAALALAYVEVSPWTAPLFFIPTLAAQRLYGMYQRQRDLAETLENTNVEFAVALVTALEASDAYTAGHSRAVAIYCRDIASRMSLPQKDIDRAFLCGLVHDIGKVGLPASLLGKTGPLNLEERRRMQEHSEIGERILREIAAYDDIATIVRYHHERMDGEGYPDGIAADQVPLLSRIIAVADAYNAMTSNRPYREAMPTRVARLRLAQAVETQFDTTVVAAFEAILASSDESYRTASGPAFRPGVPSSLDTEGESSWLPEARLGVA
jgi:HD-GYP domain-containing protein (c-di-GMP phosphodiesterase class II)